MRDIANKIVCFGWNNDDYYPSTPPSPRFEIRGTPYNGAMMAETIGIYDIISANELGARTYLFSRIVETTDSKKSPIGTIDVREVACYTYDDESESIYSGHELDLVSLDLMKRLNNQQVYKYLDEGNALEKCTQLVEYQEEQSVSLVPSYYISQIQTLGPLDRKPIYGIRKNIFEKLRCEMQDKASSRLQLHRK